VLTSAGAVHVTVPRVTDKHTDPDTGERQRLASAILPPWVRKTPRVTEVLPLLYLHGLSSGDFVPALGRFLGTTKGLSAGVVTKLTEQWAAGHPTLVAGCVNLVETERGVVVSQTAHLHLGHRCRSVSPILLCRNTFAAAT
jgi:hypothetical protein